MESRKGGRLPHPHRDYERCRASTKAHVRQPNATIEATARKRFQPTHLASWNCSRTAARSAIKPGSPAALISSLSGTLIRMVMTTTARCRTNAPPIQGNADCSSAPKWSATARAVKPSAPKNQKNNQGLMIAVSICWKAPTNVRSSVLRSPGMMAKFVELEASPAPMLPWSSWPPAVRPLEVCPASWPSYCHPRHRRPSSCCMPFAPRQGYGLAAARQTRPHPVRLTVAKYRFSPPHCSGSTAASSCLRASYAKVEPGTARRQHSSRTPRQDPGRRASPPRACHTQSSQRPPLQWPRYIHRSLHPLCTETQPTSHNKDQDRTPQEASPQPPMEDTY